jgi:hypothetical protein
MILTLHCTQHFLEFRNLHYFNYVHMANIPHIDRIKEISLKLREILWLFKKKQELKHKLSHAKKKTVSNSAYGALHLKKPSQTDQKYDVCCHRKLY